jgi:3-dehydroquinate synthase
MICYTHICRPFNTTIRFAIHTMIDFPKDLPDDDLLPRGRTLIVFDSSLPRDCIASICRLFEHSGRLSRKLSLTVRCGKSLKSLVRIWTIMADFKPELIVGVGGGTISDLVGFAAASYKRGIPYALFSTTTIAMVDAGVSGKTGVDFKGIKNAIGAIHYPLSVINVLSFLDSLSIDDFRAGFAEVVKMGIVTNSDLFTQINQWAQLSSIEQRNRLAEIIHQACITKANIIAEPSEHLAKTMYGHAIGHAIEVMSSTHLRHGDCIAIGMAMEGLLACKLGIWNLIEWDEQMKLLETLHLPTVPPLGLSLDQIIMGLEKDKYATEQDFRFVFPEHIGRISGDAESFFTSISRKGFRQLLAQIFNYSSLSKPDVELEHPRVLTNDKSQPYLISPVAFNSKRR